MVDVGTGDGLFVYNRARLQPDTFFIGIDANRRALQKISEKIYRKPAKGGLPNVLFVQAAVESLPAELDGVASEVYVNFPWGSLLAAVTGIELEALKNIRRICVPVGLLRIVVAFDEVRDRTEIERLQLPALSQEFVATTLAAHYVAVGFEIVEWDVGRIDEVNVETSWSRRLRANKNRSLVRVLARVLNSGQ